MPSGEYNNEHRVCKICGRKLRPLKNCDDWDSRKYHITCFKELLSDISNYNKVCFKKYGHTKLIGGFPADKPIPKEAFTLSFD